MTGHDERLDAYLADVTSDRCVHFCADRSGIAPHLVKQRMVDYAGEVLVGAALLRHVPLAGKRVLEVGAGLGLLGMWLRREGADICLLEPGAGGFSANAKLLAAVREWFQTDVPLIDAPAQALDPVRHGSFDVIFSINVLEHIPELEAALDAILGVLAPGGLMRHTCPNYAVPYEPHYAMPLIPFAPRATAALVPGIRTDELWQSLNFITYRRVARFCATRGLRCAFDRGMLASAFLRVDDDPAFRSRRGRLVPLAADLLKASGLLRLVGMLPPRWATPMAFSCWRV